MRLPIPQHSLVALTLVGALLTAVVAVGLTAPGAFGAATTETTGSNPGGSAVASDAPQPNESFTPAVQTQPAGEHEEEHEESEWDGDEAEQEDDHEADEDHDDDD